MVSHALESDFIDKGGDHRLYLVEGIKVNNTVGTCLNLAELVNLNFEPLFKVFVEESFHFLLHLISSL